MNVTENPVSEDNLAGKASASVGGEGGDFWGIARTEQMADILNWKRNFGVSHWVKVQFHCATGSGNFRQTLMAPDSIKSIAASESKAGQVLGALVRHGS